MFERINAILEEYKLRTIPIFGLENIHDYQGIKAHAINHELLSAVAALEKILIESVSSNYFCKKFKELCMKREELNTGSALSFFAMPDGACNQLYYNIAMESFECTNFPELLAVILPSVKMCVVPDESLSNETRENKLVDRLKVEFTQEEADIALAEEGPKSNTLYTFVTDGENLFDIRELTKLDFHRHKLYYIAISNAYYSGPLSQDSNPFILR